jgi:predicted enzyme related to lactoylglutathione lyase
MFTADMTILYVPNVVKSADFYASLFDIKPINVTPTFAMFVFENGFKLGLWSKYTVQPPVETQHFTANGEITFKVQHKADVDFLYNEWGAFREITIVQSPTEMDFGYTFTAIDPDGHRLRVMWLQLAD